MAFSILWIDDNIEELRSHVLYLGEKGYEVEGVTNGLDGVAVLKELGRRHPTLPVVIHRISQLIDDPDAFMLRGELLKDDDTTTVVRVQAGG